MGAVDIYHTQIAEDVISASVDNGLRDLHNSSYHARGQSQIQ